MACSQCLGLCTACDPTTAPCLRLELRCKSAALASWTTGALYLIAPVARGKRASERIRQLRWTDPGDSKPLLIGLLPGTSLTLHRVDELNCSACVPYVFI